MNEGTYFLVVLLSLGSTPLLRQGRGTKVASPSTGQGTM